MGGLTFLARSLCLLLVGKVDDPMAETLRLVKNGEHWTAADERLILNKTNMSKAIRKVQIRRGLHSPYAIPSGKHVLRNGQRIHWPNMVTDENGQLIENRSNLYFCRQEWFPYLMASPVWFMDATFRVISGSSVYSQLLTISVRVEFANGSKYLPIISIIMKNRKKDNYRKVFQHLRANFLTEQLSNLRYVVSDFERCISQEFKRAFDIQDLQVIYCYIHWLRIIERRSRKLKIFNELCNRTGAFHLFWSDVKQVSY